MQLRKFFLRTNTNLRRKSVLVKSFTKKLLRSYFLYYLLQSCVWRNLLALFGGGVIFLQNYFYNISVFDSLSNVDLLGQNLYNYFLFCFLLAGLVLLIALIGAIVLTLRFSSKQTHQSVFRQLSKTDNSLSFFN